MNFKFTESVVKKAFVARRQAYPDWYADGQIAPNIKAWTLASSAFDQANPSRQDFNALYNELKGKWQVFRNLRSGKALNTTEVYQLLSRLPKEARRLRLSELSDGHNSVLRRIVNEAKTIKTGKNGASLMAMSKFLHFWNPRLFIIVDRWAMAEYVFRHLWLRKSLPDKFVADADHYVELLKWGASILRDNPVILSEFHRHIEGLVADQNDLPANWKTYEATALEWFLEGVVELPPAGVLEAG